MLRHEPTLRAAILGTLLPGLVLATLALGWLQYRTLRNIIMRGVDAQLVAVSTTTAAFIDGGDHEAIRMDGDVASPVYARYVEPMRQVRGDLELTYLYTQVLVDAEGSILYVLDSTEGDEFSPPGTLDELPPGEVGGVETLGRSRSVHLTRIRLWKQWGLLKSAFAPIYRDDRVVGMAGADVDIDVIVHRTRPVLALIGGFGLIALLGGSLAARRVAERIEEPISHLRDGALAVATGEWGAVPAPAGDAEIRKLTRSFRERTERMQQTLDRAAGAATEAHARRRGVALRAVLDERADARTRSLPSVVIEPRSPSGGSRSGVARDPRGNTVVWLADVTAPFPASATEASCDDAVQRELAASVVSRSTAGPEALPEILSALVPGVVLVAWHEPGSGSVSYAERGAGGWTTAVSDCPAVLRSRHAPMADAVVIGGES